MKKVLDDLRLLVGANLITLALKVLPSGHDVTVAIARGLHLGLRGRP